MTTHVQHITRDGDRWDLLAWRYYGDPYQYEAIVKANPTVPITPHLEAGIKLAIPIVEPATVEATDLPPWKR